MAEYGYAEEDDGGVIPTSSYAPDEGYDSGPPDTLPRDFFARRAPEPVTAPVIPTSSDSGPPETMSLDQLFDNAGTATRPGAVARGFTEGVIPGLATLAGGALAGAKAGALGGAWGGPWGAAAGGIGGAVVGGLAAGYGASVAQDAALEATGAREGTGMFSRRQRQTDEALFPYSRFGGELAGGAIGLRPMLGQRALVERGVGALFGGGLGAASELYQTGHIDPVKVGMGAIVGGALPRLNRPTEAAINRVVPKSWQVRPEPAAAPEAAPAAAEVPDHPLVRTPERQIAELEDSITHATASRDAFNPQTEPELYGLWDNYLNEANERLSAARANMGDVNTEASQGPGPKITPAQADRANDTTTVAAGVAAENQKVSVPGAGNPVGSPMAAREASRSNSPARDGRKGVVPLEQASSVIFSGGVAPDIRSALGGWKAYGANLTAAERARQRTNAVAGSIDDALTGGVAEANWKPPSTPPVPEQPAARGWQAYGAGLARQADQAARTPPAARRPAPPAQRPAEPATAPVTSEPVTTRSMAEIFANKMVGVSGGDRAMALNYLDQLLATNPKYRADPAMVQAREILAARPEVAASVPDAATTAAAPPASAPAVPTAKRVPARAAADQNTALAAAMEEAARRKAAANVSRETPTPAPAPQSVQAPSGRERFTGMSPRAREIIERNRAREKATGETPVMEVPGVRDAPTNAAMAQAAPRPQKPPRAPRATAPVTPAAAKSPPTRDEWIRHLRETGVENIPFEHLGPTAQRLGLSGRGTRQELTDRIKKRIAIAPAGEPPPAAKATPPVSEQPKAPISAPAVTAAKTRPPKAQAAVEVSKRRKKIPVQDPVAAMSPDEQAAVAGAYGIDTSAPRETWLGNLRVALRKLGPDVEGSIVIGPARDPNEPAPRFGASAIRSMIKSLGAKFLDLPGTLLADGFTALTRGNSRWALRAIDELVNRNKLDPKPNIEEARRVLSERAEGFAPEQPVPGQKTPLERTTERSEPRLAALPTEATLQQKTPRGTIAREAPFNIGTLNKWREQIPEYPVTQSAAAEGKRPAKLRYEEPEEPTGLARDRREREPPYQRPKPFEPELRIDPETGEPRQTKLWRDEDIAAQADTSAYSPDDMGKIKQVVDALPEAQRPKLFEMMRELPRAQFMQGVNELWRGRLQQAAYRDERRLSTGAQADDAADFAHKQGILDITEKAYTDNPPKPHEDDAQTLARATKMVGRANRETQELVARLKKEHPDSDKITGKYAPKGDHVPDSVPIMAAARRLVNRPSRKLAEEFRDIERDAKLNRKQKRIETDIEKRPQMAEADTEAMTSAVPERAAETSLGEITERPDVPNHPELVRWVRNLSDEDLGILQEGRDLATELNTTKDPLQLTRELMADVYDAQQQRQAVKLSFEEPTPVKSTKYEGVLTPEERNEITKRLKKNTDPGAKANTGRALEKGSLEFVQAAEAAFKPKQRVTGAVTPKPKTELERAENFGGAATWKRSEAGKEWLQGLKADEGGSLDVTGIFNFLDRVAKKFRPDREPMVPTGMTRLYKGDEKWSPTKGGKEYADVPTSAIEQYRIDGVSGAATKGGEARFAKKWDKTFDIEGPDRRVMIDAEDMPFVDKVRRFLADEDGALDVSRLPNFVPTTIKKLKDFTFGGKEPNQYYDEFVGVAEKVIGWNAKRHRTDTTQMRFKVNEAIRKAVDEFGEQTPAAKKDMLEAWEDGQIERLPTQQQEYVKKHLEPLIKMFDDIYKELYGLTVKNKFLGYKNMVDPEVDRKAITRFIARRLDKTITELGDMDAPTMSRSGLSLWTESAQPREWFSLRNTDTGARQLFHVNKDGNITFYDNGRVVAKMSKDKYPPDFDPNKVGSSFDNYVIDNAKVREIEQHGNLEGGIKPVYIKDPMFTVAAAIDDMAQSLARARFLDKMIDSPQVQKFITNDKQHAIDQWGETNIGQITYRDAFPMFKDKWMPKVMQWQFDDVVKPGFNYGNNQFMHSFARFSQSAMKPFLFLGPQVHVHNELNDFIVASGHSLPKNMLHLAEATRSVWRQDGTQAEIMAAGGNPMYMHAFVARNIPNIAKMLGTQIKERHWRGDPLHKATGFNIKPYWEKAYEGSNKLTWWQSDVLYTAVYNGMKDRFDKKWRTKSAELEKLEAVERPTAEQVKKLDELTKWKDDLAKVAVTETEKVIDSYVVPTTFGKSIGLGNTDAGRALQQILTDPAIANFGRFSYGLYKKLANITKNLAGKNENMTPAQSMALGASQAGLLMLMGGIIYPALSKVYSQMPWAKPESEFEKRGITAVANIPFEFAHKGSKDAWNKLAQRAWSPAIGVNLGLTTFKNTDNVGRPIVDSSGGWEKVPFQFAEHAANQIFSPGGQISRSYEQGGANYALLRFLESNFGLKTPSEGQVRYENKRESEQRRYAKARERRPRGVIEDLGNTVSRAIRGYEHGGLVEGVIPMARK